MASCYLAGEPFHFNNYDRMGSSFDANRLWRTSPDSEDTTSTDLSQQWLPEDATFDPNEDSLRAQRQNVVTSDVLSLGWAFPSPMMDMSLSFNPTSLAPPSLSLNQPMNFDFSQPLQNLGPSANLFESPSPLNAFFPPIRPDRIIPSRPQRDRLYQPSSTLHRLSPALHDDGGTALTHTMPQVSYHQPAESEWVTSLGPSQVLIDSTDILAELDAIQASALPMTTRVEYLDPIEAQDNLPHHLSQHMDIKDMTRDEDIRPKKRHSLDLEKRHKVKQVRKMGACLRCRMYKEPCDQGTPCRNCLRKGAAAKLFRQPCYRESLDNVVAYRLGDTTFGEVRYKEPELQWSGNELSTIKVKLGYALDPNAPTFTFECRPFVPRPHDHPNLEHRINGKMEIVHLPAIAIHDIHSTTSTMNPWLKSLFPYILHTLTAPKRIDPRTPPDPLLTLTLLEAQRYSEALPDPNSSIPHALAARLLPSHQFSVLNGPALAIPTLPAPGGLGNTGATPLPPRLNAQVDMLRNRALDGHKAMALKRLKALVFGRAAAAREGWYEVFLCTFLLLSTIEHASRCQRRFMAAKRGATNWLAVKYVSEAMLAEWKYSAENLVAHFRCAMRGHVPFARIGEGNGHAGEGLGIGLGADGIKLDKGAREYVDAVSKIVEEKREAWEELRRREDDQKWEEDYVWLSQLFLGDPE